MKEVTIPNDYNPFRLEVNGRTYSYKAGTTQSVPDEVAELIDMYNKSKPVPKQNSIIDNSGLTFQKTDADKVLKVNPEGTDVEWGQAEGGGGGIDLLIKFNFVNNAVDIPNGVVQQGSFSTVANKLVSGLFPEVRVYIEFIPDEGQDRNICPTTITNMLHVPANQIFPELISMDCTWSVGQFTFALDADGSLRQS